MKDKRHTMKKNIFMLWVSFCLILGFGSATLPNRAWASEAGVSSSSAGVPESFAPLAKKVSPSVVNISTVKVIKEGEQFALPFGQNDPFRDFFNRFFGGQMPKEFKQRSLGSGFIIDKNGFILTNNHVIEKSDAIKVRLSDGSEYKAKIIGRDPKTDLALIKIKAHEKLTPIPLGDSSKLQVGDWVIAIGNPYGLGNTVTAGIVSAKYRHIGLGSYDNFIQTDASINPGNSGGPLVNTAGQVVGINSAIYSQSGGSVGIGFAIPIDMVKALLPQLKKGKVVRGWLGVMIQRVTEGLKDKLHLKSKKGALVADVTPGGPADKAGIKRGDVIISFDGKEVKEMRDLPYMVAITPVGKIVTVEVVRNGKTEDFRVKIGELKGKKAEAASKAVPDLGMTVQELTPELAKNLGVSETSGLVVTQVEQNSPASDAGIQPGDVILQVDQIPMKSLDQFRQKIKKYKAGDTILFLIKRQGSTLYLTLKVGEE